MKRNRTDEARDKNSLKSRKRNSWSFGRKTAEDLGKNSESASEKKN